MDKETEIDNTSYYKYSEVGVKARNHDLWTNINNYITDSDLTFKEKFYLYENRLTCKPSCYCSNNLKFIDMKSGFRDFCSKECMLNSEDIKNRKKQTCIDKYGVDNPAKSKEIKEKVKKTNLEKFGTEYPLQSETILEKFKSDFKEKWGVDNPSKVKEIREKANSTNVERFGSEYAMRNPEVKRSLSTYFMEKFGVDNPSKLKEVTDKRKQTIFSKYGVESALKLKEFQEKSKQTNLERYGSEYYVQTNEYRLMMQDKIFEKNSELVNNEVYKLVDNNISEFTINCSRCQKDFIINRQLYRNRTKIGEDICINCNPIGSNTSKGEKEIFNFIKENYLGEIIENYRLNKEIDIYLPELKLGFEFNGLYWHSELKRSKNYHKEKYLYFQELGIQIISFWEDDWYFKKEIIKSMILNKLSCTKIRVYARKCEIRELNDKKHNGLIREFLEQNHIQGFVGSKIKIGLFYGEELVSLMTFGDLRKALSHSKESEIFEMLRFCNKINTSVIGGSSKIFKYFLDKYKPKKVISFSDNSRSNGNMYDKIGFKLESESFGNYFWYKNLSKFHRFNFRKDKLVRMGYDKSKTEIQIMHELKYYRIWDCGQKKWVFET